MSQQINLYSPIFRKQTKIFSATTMVQGLGLIVLVVALFYYYVAAQGSLLELRVAESGQRLKSEIERVKLYGAGESPAERLKLLAERKKVLEQTLASQSQALDALKAGAYGRSEGYSGTLRALARVSVEGVWLTRVDFAAGSGELSLAGRAVRAELVPAYLRRLRADEALRGQSFALLELNRSGPQAPAAGKPPAPAFVEFTLSSGAEPPRAK
jgi:Tfp pilus assembly protein PilN